MARPTDAEIVELQNRLMRRAKYLTRSHADAADLTQDVILKIIEKAPEIPRDQLTRWSLVVMRNAHLNICTSGKARLANAVVEIDDQRELAIEGSQEATVMLSQTLRVLNPLGPRFQAAIETAVLGANNDDDVKEGTRKSTLSRAREALRERMTSTRRKMA